MALVWQGPKSRAALISEKLGSSLGEGLANFTGNYFANQKLESIMSDPQYKDKSSGEKMQALQTGLSKFGNFGRQAFERQMQVDQEIEKNNQEKLGQKKAEVLRKRLNREKLTEAEKKVPFTPQEEMAIAQYDQKERIAQTKAAQPKGGVTAQPVPPEVAQKIQQVLARNKESTADELAADLDASGIEPIHSSKYVENRRQETKAQIKASSEERAFNTGYSKKAVEEADALRASLPKKRLALDFARNAIETGNTEYFSPDKLADATGIDLFRTAKGAQLITAGKENLFSNMSRVSAKAQNMWFEQRLNSMFPKIGQSDEANLTTAEMFEAEEAMDTAYLREFDRLSEEDDKNYGYERKDIAKRARQAVEPINKHIFERASFRMKEIEEKEKGLDKLKSEVGKTVIKGTPLTLAMAKLYVDKFGKDQALQVAEKNGYYIPSIEEYQSYQQRPREFAETL